ncbi:hypothetical protein [Alistipes sp.]|uniref:hypothetical protein n=1 Tax=Alistipes sp. TaxID=1872444 RepID=UPI003AF1724D
MKLVKNLLLLAFAATLTVACDDNEAEEIEVLPYGYAYAEVNNAVSGGKVTANMLFFGLSTVTTVSTGSVFPDDTALFEIEPAADGKLYLYMHATRFAVGMPAVEMRIPQIDYATQGAGAKFTLSLAEINPENYNEDAHAWQSNSNFKITDLQGTVDNLNCSVTFTCTRKMGTKSVAFAVVYSGRLLVKK